VANHGQDPRDLLVVKSRRKNSADRAQTPEPAKGRYQFLNHNVCQDGVVLIQADEDEDEEEEEEEWLETESEGEQEAEPDGGGFVWTT